MARKQLENSPKSVVAPPPPPNSFMTRTRAQYPSNLGLARVGPCEYTDSVEVQWNNDR